MKNKKKKLEWTEIKVNIEILKRILIGYLFLGFAWIMILPGIFVSSSITIDSDKMIFQFDGSSQQRGVNTNVHNADDKRAYLFDNDNMIIEKTYTGDVNKNIVNEEIDSDTTYIPKDYIPTNTIPQKTLNNIVKDTKQDNTKYVKKINGPIDITNYYIQKEKIIWNSITAKYYLENYLEGPRNIVISNTGYIPMDCLSPRGEEVLHGDFIIAYQQRDDSINVCNVEKRFCNDGKLNGSFVQDSCLENISYKYDIVEPISFNNAIYDKTIQPEDPQNANAIFDSKGKINGVLNNITYREDEPHDAIIQTSGSVEQTKKIYPDCISPWGEIIKNNQFVRAYKRSRGTPTNPCIVELRMCINGNLKGTYTNQSCKFYDIVMNKNTYIIP